MKNTFTIYLLLIISLFACNSKKSNDNKQLSQSGQSDELKSSNSKIESAEETPAGRPKVTSAGKQSSISVGRPNVVSANANTYSIGNITTKTAGEPVIATIGKGGTNVPRTQNAKGKNMFCRLPLPIEAMPMRIKDNAICNIQFMDVEMGMTGNIVNSICEDKKETVWIGYKAGAVSKYDGKTFINYTSKEGFTGNTVNAIVEDKAGSNIWLGSNDGVYLYDGKTFTKYTDEEGLCNNSVLCILETQAGEFWFGTSSGVSKYDGESFTSYKQKEGLSNKAIATMLEDKKGNIWFGTYNDGLFEFTGRTILHYTKQEGLSGNSVYSIVEDNSGNIWMGTENGLCKFDNTSFYAYTYNSGSVAASLKDNAGNLWFGSREQGLIKYDGTGFTQYTESEGLSGNNINSLFLDKTDNLWIGTDNGMNKLVLNSFSTYEVMGLTEDGDMPIAEDKDGGIWIGTSEKIAHYDGRSFDIYNKPFSNANKYTAATLSILKDHSNNMWFGTNGGGLYKYDGNGFSKFTTNEGLNDNKINCMVNDNEGNIWLGTDAGVCKYDGNTFASLTEKEGLISNKVTAILQDKSKNLWFGTYEGLCKYNGRSFTKYTTAQGLINNSIHSLIEDISGNIWVATDSGLSNYNPSFASDAGTTPFTNYTEKDMLSNNFINTVIQDKAGNIWITTKKGMDVISKNELENNVGKPYILNLTKNDGLKYNTYNRKSAFIDKKGRAWWGSTKALIMVNLNSLSFPTQAPNVQITNIDLEQKFIDYNLLKDSSLSSGNGNKGFDKNLKKSDALKYTDVKSFYNYPLNLKLAHDLNYLTFHFTAIDWKAPHKIQYQYILQGLDKDWSPLTQAITADYRNIPPGRYSFKVKALGIANKWSEPLEYTFEIAQPWWTVWWIRGLEVCAVLFLIWLLFNWRTAQLRNRQKELEQIVFQRTAEVVAEKKEVEKQKEVVEQKNKEITDSIEYALRIQSAILPANRIVKNYLEQSFILYKPKDIVAGDFYWMETIPSKDHQSTTILFAACDCTGHGVPGAMVSVVCHNALNRAVREFDLTKPSSILDKTAAIVIESFSKSEEEIKDGMDISLVSITFNTKNQTAELEWAGANNPLWIMQKGELIETKADKQPIGMYENNKPFTNHHFTLNQGDSIYLFTDGYADQFGGETGTKKLTRKRFKDLVFSIQNKTMLEQGIALENFITSYRKELEQIDDILVMGVKV